MTGKRGHIDLVGRLADRIDVNSFSPPAAKPALPERTELTVVPPAPPPPTPILEAVVEAAAAAPVAAPAPRPTVIERMEEAAIATPRPAVVERREEPLVVAASRPSVVERMEEAPALRPQTASSNQIEIDLRQLENEGFVTPASPASQVAEEFRIIKRPLLRAAFARDGVKGPLAHVAMVTSPRPGDGKTFTALNLAMSVASEKDLHVLLVDCDMRHHGLSSKLDLARRKGLTDILTEGATIPDVMVRTNVPNLAIIPAGQPVSGGTELFASQRMLKFVNDVANRYRDRFIIFDTPPALASSEPGVLALHVGHVVMVVQANQTSKRAVAESLALVDGCPNVHFVLNRTTLTAGSDRFGYYGSD
jgi:protein-tyrosine kinase